MEFFVQTDGCRLRCNKTGTGPLMLLIHGVVCDSDYFAAAAEYLSQNFTVITYDRRGYTRSIAEKNDDFSVETQGRDAAEIIKAAGGGKAIVAGCSAGGIIALEVARKYPELVKRLFLHEPPLGIEPAYRKRLNKWFYELKECAENKRVNRAMLSFIRVLGGIDPRAPKRDIEAQKQDLLNLGMFLYHEMDDMLTYLPENTEKIQLKMPCTVAVGEKDEEGLFHQAGISAAELLNAHLVHFPGCHNVASDLPYDFAAAVTGIMNMKQ